MITLFITNRVTTKCTTYANFLSDCPHLDGLDFDEIRIWAVNEIRLHLQRNGERVLENVTPHGEELEGCFGRLMVPGV